jgi:hypothetical protein
VIDDARGASSEEKRNQYAAQIKKLVANPVHSYHKKFETPTEVSWAGRVVLALNDDPFSIRLMPNLEISNDFFYNHQKLRARAKNLFYFIQLLSNGLMSPF